MTMMTVIYEWFLNGSSCYSGAARDINIVSLCFGVLCSIRPLGLVAARYNGMEQNDGGRQCDMQSSELAGSVGS